jgi:hypothetical protein
MRPGLVVGLRPVAHPLRQEVLHAAGRRPAGTQRERLDRTVGAQLVPCEGIADAAAQCQAELGELGAAPLEAVVEVDHAGRHPLPAALEVVGVGLALRIDPVAMGQVLLPDLVAEQRQSLAMLRRVAQRRGHAQVQATHDRVGLQQAELRCLVRADRVDHRGAVAAARAARSRATACPPNPAAGRLVPASDARPAGAQSVGPLLQRPGSARSASRRARGHRAAAWPVAGWPRVHRPARPRAAAPAPAGSRGASPPRRRRPTGSTTAGRWPRPAASRKRATAAGTSTAAPRPIRSQSPSCYCAGRWPPRADCGSRWRAAPTSPARACDCASANRPAARVSSALPATVAADESGEDLVMKRAAANRDPGADAPDRAELAPTSRAPHTLTSGAVPRPRQPCGPAQAVRQP